MLSAFNGPPRERYEEALPVYRAIGDKLGEANCYYGLGEVARGGKSWPQAEQFFLAALISAWPCAALAWSPKQKENEPALSPIIKRRCSSLRPLASRTPAWFAKIWPAWKARLRRIKQVCLPLHPLSSP